MEKVFSVSLSEGAIVRSNLLGFRDKIDESLVRAIGVKDKEKILIMARRAWSEEIFVMNSNLTKRLLDHLSGIAFLLARHGTQPDEADWEDVKLFREIMGRANKAKRKSRS